MNDAKRMKKKLSEEAKQTATRGNEAQKRYCANREMATAYSIKRRLGTAEKYKDKAFQNT